MEFYEDFNEAYEASGRPDYVSILATFTEALGNEQPQPHLHALWVYIRACLEKNDIPLNWFTMKRRSIPLEPPQKPFFDYLLEQFPSLKEAIEAAEESDVKDH